MGGGDNMRKAFAAAVLALLGAAVTAAPAHADTSWYCKTC